MDNIFFSKQFGFVTYSFKNNKHTDNSAGIVFHFIGKVIHGSAVFKTLDGKELSLKEGDVLYIPLGLRYHSYWSVDEEGRLEWQSYRFSVFPQSVSKKYILQKLSPSHDALALLDRIDRDQTVSVGSVGALYDFLDKVMPDMKEDESDPRAALFARAKDYMERSPELKVPDLAKYCSMSESGLYAFFRDYADTTPIRLKNDIWAEKGTELLLLTDLSVEEIASRCGFSSVAYFRKILFERTGKTPRQIRKEQKVL